MYKLQNEIGYDGRMKKLKTKNIEKETHYTYALFVIILLYTAFFIQATYIIHYKTGTIEIKIFFIRYSSSEDMTLIRSEDRTACKFNGNWSNELKTGYIYRIKFKGRNILEVEKIV